MARGFYNCSSNKNGTRKRQGSRRNLLQFPRRKSLAAAPINNNNSNSSSSSSCSSSKIGGGYLHPQSRSSSVDEEEQFDTSFVSMSSVTTDADLPPQQYCNGISDIQLFFDPHAYELPVLALGVVWMETAMRWCSTKCAEKIPGNAELLSH